MYYPARHCKEPDKASGLFFKKGVLECLVKIVDKYIYKEFL